jgi:hypothetical protein
LAIEKRRGCGYRKIGGIYLVGEGMTVNCDRLPYNLDVCPTCNQGIKFSLGFSWIRPKSFIKATCPVKDSPCHSFNCKLCFPEQVEKAGLLWVGNRFYTPETFIEEAKTMGVSKRISHVPKDLKLGDLVFLAHKKAGREIVDGEKLEVSAIFYAFHVNRIEKIITETQSKDTQAMERLKKQNITPVIVPNNDPDHKGTVYDKPESDKKLDEFKEYRK